MICCPCFCSKIAAYDGTPNGSSWRRAGHALSSLPLLPALPLLSGQTSKSSTKVNLGRTWLRTSVHSHKLLWPPPFPLESAPGFRANLPPAPARDHGGSPRERPWVSPRGPARDHGGPPRLPPLGSTGGGPWDLSLIMTILQVLFVRPFLFFWDLRGSLGFMNARAKVQCLLRSRLHERVPATRARKPACGRAAATTAPLLNCSRLCSIAAVPGVSTASATVARLPPGLLTALATASSPA